MVARNWNEKKQRDNCHLQWHCDLRVTQLTAEDLI
jgi:hypothetical protein